MRGVGNSETVALPGLKSIIEEHYAPLLIGRDPCEHRSIWRELWGQNFGNGVALGGVDIALDDLRGKALGLPVAELYGGRLREKVPVYASAMNYIEGEDPAEYYPREAEELLKLYAARKAVPGYAFSPDTHWQEEFEDAFEYDLTPDQTTAIADIKQDMETATPMDRLLCGDVGYGKTEVAMRAAFKAVMDGKQVAFLAPTTVLAFQHLKTLRDRFAGTEKSKQ